MGWPGLLLLVKNKLGYGNHMWPLFRALFSFHASWSMLGSGVSCRNCIFFCNSLARESLRYQWHRLRCKNCGIAEIKKFVYEMVESGQRSPFILMTRHLFGPALAFGVCETIDIIKGHDWLYITIATSLRVPWVMGYLSSCFWSCTPLPPQKSKLREGLDKLKDSLVMPELEPVPQPV